MITKIFWQILRWINPTDWARWDKDQEDTYDFNWFYSLINWFPIWRRKKRTALRKISRRRKWRGRGEPPVKIIEEKLPIRIIRSYVLVKRKGSNSWVKL